MSEFRLCCTVCCVCFAHAFYSGAHSLAVNLEFGAGAAEEQFLALTSADAVSVDGHASAGSVDGAAATRHAASGSFAAVDDGRYEPVAFTQAEASVLTNITQDSDNVIFTMGTPGIEIPPGSPSFLFGHGAVAYSTNPGDMVESSLHALSVADFEFSDAVEEVLNEETGDPDYVLHLMPADWIIDVSPSAGEEPGRPVCVSIDAVIEGLLTATGAGGIADASWLVVVNEHTTLLAGSTAAFEQADPLHFAAAASHSLVVPLGGSFKLRFLWELSVTAADPCDWMPESS